MYYIIIPYRDNKKEKREYHKNFFIKNTIPLLKKCLIDVEVIFVVQDEGNPFNRGALINIGVRETNSNPQDIFITHDIDINPFEVTINTLYKPNLNHGCILGIYTSAWPTLGGIIKFKKNDFMIMNGFNNFFWGWGGEDNDLYNRATFCGFWIQKNITNRPKDKDKWFKIFDHPREKKAKDEENRLFRKYLIESFPRFTREKVIRYIKSNGLTTINYTIKSVTKEENIKYINVSLPYNPEDRNKYLELLKKIN